MGMGACMAAMEKPAHLGRSRLGFFKIWQAEK
jgi:hypothetical protein